MQDSIASIIAILDYKQYAAELKANKTRFRNEIKSTAAPPCGPSAQLN